MADGKEKAKPNLQLDFDALDDPKVRQMMKVWGSEGFGFYVAMALAMRPIPDLRLDTSAKFFWESWADKLTTEVEKLRRFTEDAVSRFELFSSDGRFLWCERVNRDVARYQERRLMQANGGRKGAESRWGPPDPIGNPKVTHSSPIGNSYPTYTLPKGGKGGTSDLDPRIWDRSQLPLPELVKEIGKNARAREGLRALAKKFTPKKLEIAVPRYFLKWKLQPHLRPHSLDDFLAKLELWCDEDREKKLGPWLSHNGGWQAKQHRAENERREAAGDLKRVVEILGNANAK